MFVPVSSLFEQASEVNQTVPVYDIVAQWLGGGVSDSRLREPGFESCAAV